MMCGKRVKNKMQVLASLMLMGTKRVINKELFFFGFFPTCSHTCSARSAAPERTLLHKVNQYVGSLAPSDVSSVSRHSLRS